MDERRERCVDELLARAGTGQGDVVHVLGGALAVVWNTARSTLGDATLVAIFHRVFSNAKRKHRLIENLQLEPNEECFRRLAARPTPAADSRELTPAVRSLLVELLSVLGTLTAEVLTPRVLAELDRYGGPPRALPRPKPGVAPAKDDERNKS